MDPHNPIFLELSAPCLCPTLNRRISCDKKKGDVPQRLSVSVSLFSASVQLFQILEFESVCCLWFVNISFGIPLFGT